MKSISDIVDMINDAADIADKAGQVVELIEAGTELAAIVRANVEEATATMSEEDAAKLRARATELAETNRALSEQLDALLR